MTVLNRNIIYLVLCFTLFNFVYSCKCQKEIAKKNKQFNTLPEIENNLNSKFSTILKDSLRGFSIDLNLFLAQHLNLEQYRNAFSHSNSHGLKSSKHALFILIDNYSSNNFGSFLNNYELIINGANCIAGNNIDCSVLISAKKLLDYPKEQPTLYLNNWSEWRPIEVTPEYWADNKTEWSILNLKSKELDIKMQYLYIKFFYSWLSVDFLKSDGWSIPEKCKGFISDGNETNDFKNLEFLSRIPFGIILTKNLTIACQNDTIFSLKEPHIIAWIYWAVPFSPKLSDP